MLKILTDMEFVQNFTPPDFQAKNLHRQFHLISTVLVRKKTKNEWKWRNLHHWEKFYTAAGSDGMDKFHFCDIQQIIKHQTLMMTNKKKTPQSKFIVDIVVPLKSR